MDTSLTVGRTLMGDSLGFHILFALLGVGLPIALSLVELWAIRRKDAALLAEAKRLTRIAVVLVVAGVVSGTIIAVQMSLVWSGLVKFGGPILGLPFMLEGYAFLLEAVFLGYYAYSWKKFQGYRHWLLSLPVILGAVGSAFFITLVDAWMNMPGGFTLVGNQITNVHVWQALLTPTAFFMISHSVVGYILATLLIVAAGYGWLMWRKKPGAATKRAAQYIVVWFCVLAAVCGVLMAIIGDQQTRYLAQSQPRKFAAIELVPQTTTHAPYIIGGELSADGKSVVGGIRVPDLLSILTGWSPDTKVPGLDQFPRDKWPLLIVNTLFEAKMALVAVVIGVPFLFLLAAWKFKKWAWSTLGYVALLVTAVASAVVIELGWMVTEFGRQPYAVSGYLTTSQAYNNNPGIAAWSFIFPTLYVVLFGVTIWALRKTMATKEAAA